MDIKEAVKRYREIQQVRRELEAKAKELKEGPEAECKEQILQYMMEQNMTSVHYPEIGRVVKVVKSHYEVTDKEMFCKELLQSLITAAQEERPLVDGFFAQFRPSKDMVVSAVEQGRKLENMGLALVEKPELSIRK